LFIYVRFFTGLESYSKVLEAFKKAKKDLGEILSACEYIDSESFECAAQNMKLKIPIEGHPYYMIIETAGSNSIHDEEKLTKFLETSVANEVVKDGTVTSEPGRMKVLIKIACILSCSGILGLDFTSLLVNKIFQFVLSIITRQSGMLENA